MSSRGQGRLPDGGFRVSAWSGHEVNVRIPADAGTIVFGIFLAGHGRIELKDPGS
jgi:hypothetical protein